tara:strand:+ start:1291 stop:1671 length:381 start_codon:yes stop_codon:yes gene_type:complete
MISVDQFMLEQNLKIAQGSLENAVAAANYCMQIMKALLGAGYAVEVHDVINRSTNLHTIIKALNSTGHDRLALYSRSESGKYTLFAGWVEFIYDNEPKYLVSDYSNRFELESILNRVHENHFGSEK